MLSGHPGHSLPHRVTHGSEIDGQSASDFGYTSAIGKEAGRGVWAVRRWEVRVGTGQPQVQGWRAWSSSWGHREDAGTLGGFGDLKASDLCFVGTSLGHMEIRLKGKSRGSDQCGWEEGSGSRIFSRYMSLVCVVSCGWREAREPRVFRVWAELQDLRCWDHVGRITGS